jgi:uncharacterized protein YaaR (DUF327 family)
MSMDSRTNDAVCTSNTTRLTNYLKEYVTKESALKIDENRSFDNTKRTWYFNSIRSQTLAHSSLARNLSADEQQQLNVLLENIEINKSLKLWIL